MVLRASPCSPEPRGLPARGHPHPHGAPARGVPHRLKVGAWVRVLVVLYARHLVARINILIKIVGEGRFQLYLMSMPMFWSKRLFKSYFSAQNAYYSATSYLKRLFFSIFLLKTHNFIHL